MKKLLCFLLLLAAGGLGVYFFQGVDRNIPAKDDGQAAQILLESLKEGRQKAVFTGDFDQEEIFRILECRYPYAFSMRATTYRSGKIEIEIEIEDGQAQRDGVKAAQETARRLIKPDMTVRGKLEALHNYLVLHCAYDTTVPESPQGSSRPFTAAGAMLDGRAVCAGYSRAFAAMCEAAGIEAVYVADAGMNHGWNAVRIHGKTYFIDCTYDDPVPDRPDSVSVKYFCRTAEQLSLTHQWDKVFYEEVLDSIYPEFYGDIQRVMDLGLLPNNILVSQTGEKAERETVARLSETVGAELSRETTLGELCREACEKLSEQGAEGVRRIDRLVADGKVTLTRAREAGF